MEKSAGAQFRQNVCMVLAFALLWLMSFVPVDDPPERAAAYQPPPLYRLTVPPACGAPVDNKYMARLPVR